MRHGQLEIESGQFGVGDLQADRVDAVIQFGADFQSSSRCRVRNQIDDHPVADQGPPFVATIAAATALLAMHRAVAFESLKGRCLSYGQRPRTCNPAIG